MPNPVYYGFTGIIDSPGATRICSAFNGAINSNVDEIHLCVSSPGGLVADGIFLYNFVRGLPVKTIFYNIGSIASIALNFFVAAEERYCSQYSMFMTHPSYFNPAPGMTATIAQTSLDASLADDARIEQILRDRTTAPDTILSDRRIKDVHIKPSDAIQYGIALQIREFSLPRGNQIFQI